MKTVRNCQSYKGVKKLLTYGPKSCMQNVVFKFNEGTVDIVKEYKYLGVVISSVQKLNGNVFKNHFVYISEKPQKLCILLYIQQMNWESCL